MLILFPLLTMRKYNEKGQTRTQNVPNFIHSNAHPGNEVVAPDVFVKIYSSLSLAVRPVVFVFPWLVYFLYSSPAKFICLCKYSLLQQPRMLDETVTDRNVRDVLFSNGVLPSATDFCMYFFTSSLWVQAN